MEGTYSRTGQVSEPQTPQEPKKDPNEPIRVNGFQQVIEMLRIADDEFRMSLLRRLDAADPELGRSIKLKLREMGIL